MASGLSTSTTMQSVKLPGRKHAASLSSFSECAACTVAPVSTSCGVIPHCTQARLIASGRLSELLVPGLRSDAIAMANFASRMASIGGRGPWGVRVASGESTATVPPLARPPLCARVADSRGAALPGPRSTAMFGPPPLGPRSSKLDQRGHVRLARRPNGSRDAALVRLLRVIGDATHALGEFVGTRPGEHRMGVGVDEPRDDAGAGRVEEIAVENHL